RRPHRTHSVQRRGGVTGDGRSGVLLRQPAPPTHTRVGTGGGRPQPSRRERGPCTVVRRLLLSHQSGAHLRLVADLFRRRGAGRASLDDGRIFGFEVRTDYPDDGLIRVRITDAPSGKVGLRLRVPDWAEGAELQEGGTRRRVDPGFAVVERRFVRDEEILLHLPMKARLTWPDPRSDAVRGCVAVERGPLVHCVESIDLPEGVGLDDVLLDPRVAPYERAGQVRARGVLRPGDRSVSWSLPYGATEGAVPSRSVELTLSPYHEWAR